MDETAPYVYLKNNMSNFGPIEEHLTCKIEHLSNSANFLDLTLTIQEDGTITYKMFQEPDNYFLYHTQDSC